MSKTNDKISVSWQKHFVLVNVLSLPCKMITPRQKYDKIFGLCINSGLNFDLMFFNLDILLYAETRKNGPSLLYKLKAFKGKQMKTSL
jgi:hypothetical protein